MSMSSKQRAPGEAVGSGQLESVGDGGAERLRACVAAVLRVAPGELRTERPLAGLGIDSLAAVELRSRLAAEFGIDVGIAELLESATLGSLEAQRASAAPAATAESVEPALPAPPPAVAATSDHADHPVSQGQLSLWLLEQLAPESGHQNLVFAARVRNAPAPIPAGELARRAQSVVQALADRHAALRTTFPAPGGDPIQRVHRRLSVACEEIDAGGWTAAQVGAAVAAFAHRPFALTTEPPLRLAVLSRAAEDPVLVAAVHHIALDHGSFELLRAEIARLFPAGCGEAPAALAPPAAQASDFARWQELLLAGPEGERQGAYWQEQLAGELPGLALPGDRPRRPGRSYRGATVAVDLDAAATAQVRELARQQETTLYVVLLAAFELLLHRVSGEGELLLGTPASGRTVAALREVVGYLMNPLVLRSRLDGEAPFAGFLAATRGTVLGGLSHQDYPTHLLAERLRAGHEGDLFRAMFIWNRPQRREGGGGASAARFVLGEAGAQMTVGGLALESYALPERRASLDLQLMMVEDGDGIAGSLLYPTERFDRATVLRLAGQLRCLLAGIVADPDCAAGGLPLLTAAESHQLVHEWNAGAWPAPAPAGVHRRISAQAAATPDAVAVVGVLHLTYGELERRSNQLARRLQGAGIGAEARVALFLERRPELIVAMLAVQKAGGAYVPIDPAYPPQRVSLLLSDSAAALLLTASALLSRVPADRPPVLCLDADWRSVAALPARPLAELAQPSNPVYAIYTSGSLGRPKGVLVPHAALAAYTEVAATAYGIGGNDRVLQFASISFDTCAEEVYPCLTRGATLVLRDEAMLASIADFLAACSREQVTVLDLPTAFWHELAGERTAALPAAVRLVILGGERVRPEVLAAWFASESDGDGVSGVRLVNSYGPTEATIVATMADLAAPAAPAISEVSIGRPIAGARAHVLDRGLRPVPIGAVGELYLGGRGLARGYLGQPGLTAERFLPDPLGEVAGARLYKTGDRVQPGPDGELVFAGRVDHQLKVRGYRVEPGEIEAVLGSLPALREAVVLAREEAPGRSLLAAYVVPAAGHGAPSTADLARFAGERLPAYMVPAAFVVLPALPLTPSGKLDRLALPAPVREGRAGVAPPRTATEELVAGVCAEVLGLTQIGRDEDLFELGCHSLLAMRIVARLRETLQVELPLVNVFATPTVAQLAARIVETMENAPGIEGAEGAEGAVVPAARRLPPLVPAPRSGPLPLSFAQERIWFLTQLEPELRAYHVPRALRLSGHLDPALVAAAFAEIVRRHEILRTTFPAAEGVPMQVVHPPAPLPLPLIDLTGLPEELREPNMRGLLLELGRQLFDLEKGPLIRVRLVRLAAEEHVLSMTEHHLVHDGWTQGVLLSNFVAIYHAFMRGAPSPLPPLPVQYVDFACWQRQWLRDEVLESQLRYWLERLAGAPATLDLPFDRPRPAVQTFSGMLKSWVLPASLCRDLRATSRQLGATVFMTMLAGFEALLLRYTAQDDLVVGTGVANRRVVEVEGLLGMLINTLALRFDASGNPSFAQFVERVRAVCLGAYANQDLPFEKVVAALLSDRTLSHAPLFQVMFAFMDTPMPDIALPGLELEVLETHNRSAKMDINLTVILPSEQGIGLRVGGRPDEITLLFEFSTDVFEPVTADRMLRHYQALLANASTEPATRLSELPLLSAAERHQLLVELAGQARTAPAPDGLCLHERFEAQVDRAPGATAVSWDDASWTYAELEARANRLAWRLRAAGAGPERLVGLCAESPPALILGILGTLKAGAAYLPLDPQLPRARWELVLGDAGVDLVVTEPQLTERFAEWAGRPPRLLPVAVDEALPEPASARRPVTGVTPQHAAYAIYTSGSTGAPKGVLVSHANVGWLLSAMAEVFAFGPGEAWTLFHSCAFDFSVWEIWGALAWGGRLVLVPRWQRQTPSAFYELLIRQGVTVLNQTPSAFGSLLRTLGESREGLSAAPPDLRWVIFGGETLDVGALAPWMEHNGSGAPAMMNGYGITETTVFATFHRVTAADLLPRRGSLIGWPLAGLTAYVLDRAGNPVPQGVPGELYVGGRAVTRGYLRRPALTAERFVPDPFTDGEAGGRLYKSGDLVRFAPHGELEFLGRRDHQVKVRGYRIELGEIEALLAAQPQVAAATVVVREVKPDDRRLVAYAAIEGDAAETAGEARTELAAQLRTALQKRLPDYMVPAQIVLLDRLPRTLGGKVDRQALPAPSGERPELRSYVAPQNPVEEVLAGMVAELLDLERVGAGDNFFDLGGHSLQATQLAAWVRDSLQVELPLRALFEDATIAGLAATLLEDAARRPAILEAARLVLEMTALSDDEVERQLDNLRAAAT